MRKWAPLLALCLGAFMLLVDVTIVNVALPDMAGDLKSSFASLQWVFDIYALAVAALLLAAGAVADRFGRRQLYLIGLAVFAGASFDAGLAPGVGVLIVARAVQGVGAAAVFATATALLSTTYAGRDRAVAFGVWGAVNGGAAATGPIIGGLLTGHLGWRSIFLVNLPVAAVAMVLARRVVPESRSPSAARVDIPGAGAFTVAAGSVTFALIRGGSHGWSDGVTVALFAVAAAALAGFVVVEGRTAAPLVDLALLRRPPFVGLMAGALVLQAAAFADLVYVSIWLQSVRGMSPIGAGLAMTPLAVTAFVVAGGFGSRLHGLPVRVPVGGGLLLIGAGGLELATVSSGSSWTALVPGLVIVGIGAGLSTPIVVSAALGMVEPRQAGMAGGAVETFFQLGFALGIAVLGTLFTSRIAAVVATSAGGSGAAGDPRGMAAAFSAGRAGPLVAAVPPERRAAVDRLAHAALAAGLDRVFVIAGYGALAAAVLVFALVRTTRPAKTAPQAASESPVPVPLPART
jgi:EmrB/QacA subfamily drug resistance transporter